MSKNETKVKEQNNPKPASPPGKLQLQCKAITVKSLMNMIATICEEPTLEATQELLKFRAMDTSHIACLDIEIPSKEFDSFSCTKDMKFTIKAESLQNILKRFSDKSVLSIAIDENDAMNISTQDGFVQSYTLHLLETAYSNTPLPKMDFNSKVEMKNSGLAKIIKDIDVISDHIDIDVGVDSIRFYGKSDVGHGSIELPKVSENIVSLEVKEPSKSTYNLDYLKSFMQCVYADALTLELSSKMPLRIETKLEDKGRIHFYLAPRIDK